MTIAQSCFRILMCCSLTVPTLQAFCAEVTPDKAISADGAALLSLDKEQRLLADTFTRLEETFIKRADIEASSNPTRAHLLRQAAQLSKQLATQQRLNIAVDYLAKGQFTRALQEQEAARDNLQKLLSLLQQENRSKRLRDERDNIEKLIKEVHRIERLQRSLRGRTEAGQEMSEAKQEQESLKNETSKVGDALEKANKSNEEESKPGDAGDQPKDSKSDQDKSGKESHDGNKSESGDKDPAEQQEADKHKDADKQAKPKDSDKDKAPQEAKQPDKDADKKTEGEQKQGSGENSDPSKQDSSKQDSSKEQSPDSQGKQDQSPSNDQQSQDGQAKEGQSQQGDQSKQDKQDKHQSPEKKAQDRVQRARQRMQQAQEQLQKDERQDAVEQQREAERELAAAVEELESILRQMREEEVERSLASLESRFRKMLTMQTEVLKQTEKYANVDGGLEERQIELQSVKLGIEEKKILIEGQQAMLLLEEEGSSMAFPEAVEQLNSDVALIVELFKQNRMDHSNVQLQQQVVATLEELLESLTAVQKDKEKKKEQKKGQQNGNAQQGQQSQDLIDKLAELRLIRTLQMRINKRTGWLAQQSGANDDPLGQVQDPLLSQQTRELAQRQERLEGVLRDIILHGNEKK